MAERNPFARDKERSTGPTSGGIGSPGTGGSIQQGTGDLAGQAQDKAAEITQQVKEQAVSGLSGQKGIAANSLHSVAEAMRKTGQQLREQDQATVADYANNAAGQVDRLSHYLRENDIDEMVGEVERFARRQPAVFLSGAVVLGALGARFLKSSGQKRRTMPYTGTGYTPPAYRSNLGGLGNVSAGENVGTTERGTVVPWPRPDEPTGGTGGTKGPSGGTEE